MRDRPTQIRSCCRCGVEFRSVDRALVCPTCRKKKEPQLLSFREMQIVDLIKEKAAPNKEIAFQLHLSEGTIKEYLNRIFRKVGVSSRTELAIWAMTKWKGDREIEKRKKERQREC